MEKLTFALVTAARKRKLFFQAYTMIILTDKPLRHAMSHLETAGRLALWAIEWSKFDIQYRPRTTIKGQTIADFTMEFTNGEGQGADEHPRWSIHTNGSSNKQAGGAGIVLRSLEGNKIECIIHLDFPTPTMKQSMKF